jgi:hypothetical protein
MNEVNLFEILAKAGIQSDELLFIYIKKFKSLLISP